MAVPWGICPILREYGPVWGSVRVGRGPGKPLRFFAPSCHGCNPSYATDLVVCVALGCDMFDCVFPTRTARFGSALVPTGNLQLRRKVFEKDFGPINPECTCPTCQK